MQNLPRLVGIVQIALALTAAIVATGWFAVPPEVLAAIIAAQNALTGGARLRSRSPGDDATDASTPPPN